MIGNIKAVITVGIILCLIPVLALGQTFNSMPKDTINNRFYPDIISDAQLSYPIKHPSLTINGFDNGGDNSHGYGLKQVLQIVYNQGQDPLMEANFNKIVATGVTSNIQNPDSKSNTKQRLNAVNQNSNIAQSRAFVALERYICYKNGVTNQIPNHTTSAPSYSVALDSLKSVLTLPYNYLLVDGSDFVGEEADQVKFTRSLMNMARTLDLYLALENAYTKWSGYSGNTI